MNSRRLRVVGFTGSLWPYSGAAGVVAATNASGNSGVGRQTLVGGSYPGGATILKGISGARIFEISTWMYERRETKMDTYAAGAQVIAGWLYRGIGYASLYSSPLAPSVITSAALIVVENHLVTAPFGVRMPVSIEIPSGHAYLYSIFHSAEHGGAGVYTGTVLDGGFYLSEGCMSVAYEEP